MDKVVVTDKDKREKLKANDNCFCMTIMTD